MIDIPRILAFVMIFTWSLITTHAFLRRGAVETVYLALSLLLASIVVFLSGRLHDKYSSVIRAFTFIAVVWLIKVGYEIPGVAAFQLVLLHYASPVLLLGLHSNPL